MIYLSYNSHMRQFTRNNFIYLVALRKTNWTGYQSTIQLHRFTYLYRRNCLWYVQPSARGRMKKKPVTNQRERASPHNDLERRVTYTFLNEVQRRMQPDIIRLLAPLDAINIIDGSNFTITFMTCQPYLRPEFDLSARLMCIVNTTIPPHLSSFCRLLCGLLKQTNVA